METVGVNQSAELARIIDGREVVSRYQPIVELESGRVAGYEALARGPQGSVLEFPDRLFGVARDAGRLAELDAVCRAAALRGARGSAIEGQVVLFVNTEPDATGTDMVDTYAELLARGADQRVVFEFTERALTDRPAEVLAAARRLRALGAGIALDDVGVDPRSLALLAFVQPDIVKLDMAIVQGARTPAAAWVMHAVGAYAERTGAAIIAEGIETPEHLAIARSLGATHGQGWLFGRPEAAPATIDDPTELQFARREHTTADANATAYELVVAAGRRTQLGDKSLILALSKQLELHAHTLGAECVVLGNLQHVEHLSERTGQRYAELADGAAFVGLIGAGVPAEAAPGVRGGSFDTTSVLASEWTVAVISPHFAAAMVAVDLGDRDLPDLHRRFRFTLTYDRALVAGVARALMAQITPA